MLSSRVGLVRVFSIICDSSFNALSFSLVRTSCAKCIGSNIKKHEIIWTKALRTDQSTDGLTDGCTCLLVEMQTHLRSSRFLPATRVHPLGRLVGHPQKERRYSKNRLYLGWTFNSILRNKNSFDQLNGSASRSSFFSKLLSELWGKTQQKKVLGILIAERCHRIGKIGE